MEKGQTAVSGKRLFVGIANSQPTVPSEFFWSFIGMDPACRVAISRTADPDSCVRLNKMLAWFLESDCDYFINIDIDQIYPKDYLKIMVPLIEKYKVIGPLIYDRWAQNSFMPLAFKEAEKDTLSPKRLFDKDKMKGIQEVPYSHTNLFMAREVVEKLTMPVFELFFAPDCLSKNRHTDFDVNDKIKTAGYPIYINFDMIVKHIVEIGIDEEVYDKWHKDGFDYRVL